MVLKLGESQHQFILSAEKLGDSVEDKSPACPLWDPVLLPRRLRGVLSGREVPVEDVDEDTTLLLPLSNLSSQAAEEQQKPPEA